MELRKRKLSVSTTIENILVCLYRIRFGGAFRGISINPMNEEIHLLKLTGFKEKRMKRVKIPHLPTSLSVER